MREMQLILFVYIVYLAFYSGLSSPVPQLAQEHLHRQYKAETRSLHQGMSPWLQVRPAPGFSYERQLSGSSQDSSTLGGGDQNDFLSVSSGQRSRLSSISQSSVSGHRSALSSARSDVSFRLTSITPTHYGSPKSMSLMGSQSPTQISKMEKRTMDRRIQSLLHWTCVWESEERQLQQASYTGTQSQPEPWSGIRSEWVDLPPDNYSKESDLKKKSSVWSINSHFESCFYFHIKHNSEWSMSEIIDGLTCNYIYLLSLCHTWGFFKYTIVFDLSLGWSPYLPFCKMFIQTDM